MTLKRRILIRIYVLTFLIILAMAGTYYYLFTRDIRERSYQNVTMAFNLIMDDLRTRVNTVVSQLDHFIQGSLVNPMYVLQVFQGQQEKDSDEAPIWYVKKLMTYLSSIATGIYEFGTLIGATEILVYDKQGRLLAMYQSQEEENVTGVYLPEVNQDAFVLMRPNDLWYATLQNTAEIPLQPLPKYLPTSYQEEFPETLEVMLNTFNQIVTLQFTAPINNAGEVQGVYVIHVGIRPKDVLRYSRLSQTKVNFFAGTDFSVGTLPEYTTLPEKIEIEPQTLDLLSGSALPPIAFSDLTVVDHSYYQGTLVIGTPDQMVGAITTLFPRQLEEKQRKNLFLVIMGVALVFSLLAAGEAFRLSETIVRPITQMIQVIRVLAQGDLRGVVQDATTAEESRKGWFFSSWNQREQSSRRPSNNELTLLAQALQSMVGYLQDVAKVAEHIAHGEINQEIAPRSDRDVLGQSFHHMTDYLHEIATVATAMAKGDMRQAIQPKTEYDVLGNSFQEVIGYVQNVADVAEKISDGDLHVDVRPKSQQDILNHALTTMITYIQNVAGVAEKISNNDLDVDVQLKSDQDILNQSLQKMVTNLQMTRGQIEQSMREVEQQNWFKTGQAELSDTMRGEQDLTTLANSTITYLAKYLEAHVGTIYLMNEDRLLDLVGKYAYTQSPATGDKITLGEGLVGQAALEKESLLVTDIPEDYFIINSSLGKIVPRYILVTPFIYGGEVKGVLELGTIHKFGEIHRDFIEQAAETIAIVFNSTQARAQMRKLLEATQQQAEELQTQREQLRMSNEELESQTSILRESERKLRAQQEELQQTNEELADKSKALELSNTYKSEFLANMSHELRTPLNSLLILARLLSDNKDGNLTDKQIEFSRMIHTAGSDLLLLINEILDLSKVEAGKMELNIDEMNIKGLASYIRQNFTHMAEEQGLYLKVDLAPELPAFIYTDRQRVEQIVKNFLSNAIKFTDSGGITVQISHPASGIKLSSIRKDAQNVIAISVSDTGIGIPDEKQKTIFEAFQQADGTTSRKFGGTGLGLSISRELVRLLDGEIQLESKKNKGSTFTLYLPEKSLDSSEYRPAAKDKKDEAESPSSLTSPYLPITLPSGVEAIRDDRHNSSPTDKFLLIIEDDPKFAKILFELVREKGYKGLLAGDGAAGLQLAYQYKPKAVVLDIGLPHMDGWTVLDKLKENSDTSHIPVHCISADDRSLDALKKGAIGYLTKPVTIDTLHDAFVTIEKAITRKIKRLLVVENDETMRKSLMKLFNDREAIVTSLKTGHEAYDLLKSDEFDCMVLDLGLGDISGFDVLDKIKGDNSISHIPIIVYTGKELSKEEEKRLKKHTVSIIIKGVRSPERLLDEVTGFVQQVEEEGQEAQQETLQLNPDTALALKGKKILLVDDDMRNVYALMNILEERDIELIIGENGREALKLVDTHSDIDLVLMDIMMPEMDGYEATREIRKQHPARELPIIALTAKAMKGDRQKCLDVGANDYLSKPIDVDKLLALLQVWLG